MTQTPKATWKASIYIYNIIKEKAISQQITFKWGQFWQKSYTQWKTSLILLIYLGFKDFILDSFSKGLSQCHRIACLDANFVKNPKDYNPKIAKTYELKKEFKTSLLTQRISLGFIIILGQWLITYVGKCATQTNFLILILTILIQWNVGTNPKDFLS